VDGVPHKAGTLVVDVFSGLSAFAACQAALAEQARDRARGAAPRRRHLDVSLMQAAASMGAPALVTTSTSTSPAARVITA
jgi:crotonobetainyl-CoA:carnitine CoA-transferase CaiB-like acyl-CoA transferase